MDLQNDNFLWDKLSWCYFPGNNFFKLTKSLVATEREVGEFLYKVEKKKGWLTQYNRRHNMSSPFRIDEVGCSALFEHSIILSVFSSLCLFSPSSFFGIFFVIYHHFVQIYLNKFAIIVVVLSSVR